MDASVVCNAAWDAIVNSQSAHFAVIMSRVALDAAINALFNEAEEAVAICKAALHAAKVIGCSNPLPGDGRARVIKNF
jgi:hypothetical protein